MCLCFILIGRHVASKTENVLDIFIGLQIVHFLQFVHPKHWAFFLKKGKAQTWRSIWWKVESWKGWRSMHHQRLPLIFFLRIDLYLSFLRLSKHAFIWPQGVPFLNFYSCQCFNFTCLYVVANNFSFYDAILKPASISLGCVQIPICRKERFSQ